MVLLAFSACLPGCFSLENFDYTPIYCDYTTPSPSCPFVFGQALRCVDGTVCELPNTDNFQRLGVPNEGCKGRVTTAALSTEDRIHGGCQVQNCGTRNEPYYGVQTRSLVLEGDIAVKHSAALPGGVVYLGARDLLWLKGDISASGTLGQESQPVRGALIVLDASDQGVLLVNEGVNIDFGVNNPSGTQGCFCAAGAEIQGLAPSDYARGEIPLSWLVAEGLVADSGQGALAQPVQTNANCNGDTCVCDQALCRTLVEHFRSLPVNCGTM